jgi:FAD/FMN-containing dehydrogenase
MKISNWGNYPVIEAAVESFETEGELKALLKEGGECIARGLGRCYGDSALSDTIIETTRFNHMLAFDETTGLLACEAGVSLEEILDAFVPRGWFLPVTPGTKFVTVGGAIASDVHGKNHHLSGSFSNQVVSMDVMTADGKIHTCTKRKNKELFWATCGGMGLTGVVLRASFHLIPVESAYIRQETIKAKNLDEIMAIFEASTDWTYSVAWIDCLAGGENQGRSIMMRGEHAKAEELTTSTQKAAPLKLPEKGKLNVPFNFPSFALNTWSVKAFNELYYRKAPEGTKASIIGYESFFYPLDAIHNWNRIYGKRGFTQYQFVLPKARSKEGLKKILDVISASGEGSFLAVLKLFGKQDDLISFPKEGYTLALDFPITPRVFELFKELDRLVLEHDGRLYLTKDVRMDAAMMAAGYEKLEVFREIKKKYDPANRFASLQSKRVGL